MIWNEISDVSCNGVIDNETVLMMHYDAVLKLWWVHFNIFNYANTRIDLNTCKLEDAKKEVLKLFEKECTDTVARYLNYMSNI